MGDLFSFSSYKSGIEFFCLKITGRKQIRQFFPSPKIEPYLKYLTKKLKEKKCYVYTVFRARILIQAKSINARRYNFKI